MPSASLPVSEIVQKKSKNRKVGRADREIEFRTPPCVPVLPPGALVYSTVVFVGQSTSTAFHNACNRVYGAATSPKHANILGRRLQGATDCIGGGALSYGDMLMNHSAAGFYFRLVPASVELDWTQRRTGDSTTDGTSAAYPGFARLGLRSPSMKYCPVCASLDTKTSGFPVWRVIHQLSFVEVCGIHRVTLVHSCSRCGEALDRGHDFRLPGQLCRSCGAHQTHHVSRPSETSPLVMLSELCEEIFSGGQEYLRPENWLAHIKDLQTKHSIEKIAKEVHLQLADRYGREPNVAPALVDAISKRSVEYQLSLLALPHQFLSRILVGERLAKMGLIDRAEAPTPQHVTAEHGLEVKAVEQGIPAGFVRPLLSGVSPAQICKDHGGDRNRLVAFQASIPPDFELGKKSEQWKANQLAEKKQVRRLAKRPRYRTVLDEFVRLNPDCKRHEFRAAYPEEAEWLFINDRPHFDAVLPARFHTYGKTLEEKVEMHQAVILDLLRENPKISRGQLVRSKQHRSYDFLRENANAWLDEMVPYRPMGANKALPSWYKGAAPFQWPDTPLKSRYVSTAERRSCCKAYISQLIELNPQLTAREVARAGSMATVFLRQDRPKWLVAKLGQVQMQLDGRKPKSRQPALLKKSTAKRKRPLARSKGS